MASHFVSPCVIGLSRALLSKGENYGGVGDVYMARWDKSFEMKVNSKVAQEARWSSVRDEFILVEGKSPSGERSGMFLIEMLHLQIPLLYFPFSILFDILVPPGDIYIYIYA